MARESAPAWRLVFADVPEGLRRTVQRRRHPDLHLPDGIIECYMRSLYVSPAGQRRGSMWLRFVATPETPAIMGGHPKEGGA